MDAMGFTEHGFRHANLVAQIAYQVLHRLGFSEREAQLASVAGYLHDVGNALARDVARADRRGHGLPGAQGRVTGHDLMPIVAAIANHEETEGTAVSPDLRRGDPRGQVRRAPQPRPQSGQVEQDIHDRVNYAVEQSFLRVDSDARTVSLELTIDTRISQVMEYFEIFLGRMQMCRLAAESGGRALPARGQRAGAGVKRNRRLWVSIVFVCS